MLQRGIETDSLNVQWVSSLSWYFINLFGLQGLLGLYLQKSMDFVNESGLFIPQAPFGVDISKIIRSEKEFVELLRYKSSILLKSE